MRKVLFVCLVALLVLGAQAERSLLKKRKKKAAGASVAVLVDGKVAAGIPVDTSSQAQVDPQLVTGIIPATTLFYAGVAYGPGVGGTVPYAQVTLINWEYAIGAFNSFYSPAGYRVPTTILINLNAVPPTPPGAPTPHVQTRTLVPTGMVADVTSGLVVFKVSGAFGFVSGTPALAPIGLPPCGAPGRTLVADQVVSLASFAPGAAPTPILLTEAVVGFISYGASTFTVGNVITGAGPVVNSADVGSIAFDYAGGGSQDKLWGIFNNGAVSTSNGAVLSATYTDLTNCYARAFIACNSAQTGWNAASGCAATCAGQIPVVPCPGLFP